MAPAGTRSVSCVASRSAPCLVRTKNSVRPGVTRSRRATSTLPRGAPRTPGAPCVERRRPRARARARRVGEVAADRGRRRRGRGSPRTASGARPAGHRRGSVTTGRKPRSAMWSASSRDGDLDRRRASSAPLRAGRPAGRAWRRRRRRRARSRGDLAADRRAAEDGGEAHVDRVADRGEGVGDLLGELAGRDEDQAARAAAGVASRRAGPSAAGRRPASCRSRSGSGRGCRGRRARRAGCGPGSRRAW